MRLSSVNLLACLFAIIVFSSHAQAMQESDFVGMYTQGGMESQSQMFLLDDNTFCYTLIAGSLDMIKAGRWRLTQGEATINLQEVQPDTQIYPAIGKNMDRLGPPMVSINIDGYTLSNARSPVFAVSSTDTQPATFRPLFSAGKNGWSGTYLFPLIAPEKAQYFFIGDIEVSKYGKPLKLRVTQYKIENYDTIRIGYNEMQSNPAMNVNVQLVNNVLQMGGERFGSQKPLNQKTIIDVREQCINPIMFPDKVVASEEKEADAQAYGKAEILKPIKSFKLDMAAIVGEPFFGGKDDGVRRGTDSLDSLIESEKQQLQVAFESAKGDAKAADDFLQLSKSMAGKKRVERYAPLIVKLYAELLVAKNGQGEFSLTEKIFFHFMENLYPVTEGVKNKEMDYGMSVIASQGLILTVATKNDEISKLIFGKLLGDKFDISTHQNRVLIYNLACYYAVNNNKTAMLDAIKQARKRKTPAKQFMDDSDFKSYWKDEDFLNAIKD